MLIPTRPTYHHGDLRNSLIRAALGLVAERGVEGFSLREAARTVGVSASACYRHFADREELLAAVAHEGSDTLAEKMRAAGEAHAGDERLRAVGRFWDYSEAYLHFAIEHPAHFRVMHAVPKSAHSREMMLPRSPALLAQGAMNALVAAGVVAPETAGRALLACWTSVHGLASLAVNGHLPLDDELTLEAALDAVLRTALLGAGADAALLPPEHPLPGGACPGMAELVGDAAADRFRSRPRAREPRAAAAPELLGCARMTLLDLTPDELLSTTRSVRKRLDFERPVEREVLDECLALAQQAPNASNSEPWRFVVVTEADDQGEARRVLRDRLGRLSRGDGRAGAGGTADRRCSTRRSTSPTASTRCR